MNNLNKVSCLAGRQLLYANKTKALNKFHKFAKVMFCAFVKISADM